MNAVHPQSNAVFSKKENSLSPLARKARVAFTWLSWIFAAGIVVQVLLAGMALFYDADRWADHARAADFVSVIPVLMLAASFVARLPKVIRLQTGALIGMIALIVLCAMFASEIGWLASLHPVIALFLFFRTMAVIRLTKEV